MCLQKISKVECHGTVPSPLSLVCSSQNIKQFVRIAYARRLNQGYNFLVLDGTNLPLENNSIDYILTLSVLHHIASEDLAPYLSEFQRILKPHGKVVVLEPCLLKECFFLTPL